LSAISTTKSKKKHPTTFDAQSVPCLQDRFYPGYRDASITMPGHIISFAPAPASLPCRRPAPSANAKTRHHDVMTMCPKYILISGVQAAFCHSTRQADRGKREHMRLLRSVLIGFLPSLNSAISLGVQSQIAMTRKFAMTASCGNTVYLRGTFCTLLCCPEELRNNKRCCHHG
jgi:hypothetical protein